MPKCFACWKYEAGRNLFRRLRSNSRRRFRRIFRRLFCNSQKFIKPPGSAVVLRQSRRCLPCCASSRPLCDPVPLRTSRLQMVEAGGVEPPSEKPCHPKTTCLSRSEGFAGGTQSGQDAPPASPMISPPHYGPKCDGQPTV